MGRPGRNLKQGVPPACSGMEAMPVLRPPSASVHPPPISQDKLDSRIETGSTISGTGNYQAVCREFVRMRLELAKTREELLAVMHSNVDLSSLLKSHELQTESAQDICDHTEEQMRRAQVLGQWERKCRRIFRNRMGLSGSEHTTEKLAETLAKVQPQSMEDQLKTEEHIKWREELDLIDQRYTSDQSLMMQTVAQNGKLRQIHQQALTEHQAYKAKSTAMHKELESKCEKLDQEKSEVDQKRIEKEAAAAQAKKDAEKYKEYVKKEIEKLRQEKRDGEKSASDKHQHLLDRFHRLEAERDSIQGRLNSMTEEKEKKERLLKEQHTNFQDASANLRGEAADLRTKLERWEEEKAAERAEAAKEKALLDEEIAKLKEQLLQLENEKAVTEGHLADREKSEIALISEKEELQKQLDVLQSGSQKEVQEKFNLLSEQHAAEITRVQKELDAEKEMKATAQKDLERVQTELDAKTTEISSKEESLKNEQEAVANLKKQLQESETQKKSAEDSASAAVAREAALQKEMEGRAIESTTDVNEKQVTGSTSSDAALADELKAANNNRGSTAGSNSTDTVLKAALEEDLQGTLKAREEELESRDAALKERDAEVLALRQELEALRRSTAGIIEETPETEDSSGLRTELEAKDGELKQLREQINSEQEKHNAEVERLQGELELQTALKGSTESQAQELLDAEIKRLQGELQSAQQSSTEAQAQALEKHDAEVKKLQEDLNSAQQSSTQEQEKYLAELKALQEELKSAQESSQNAQKTLMENASESLQNALKEKDEKDVALQSCLKAREEQEALLKDVNEQVKKLKEELELQTALKSSTESQAQELLDAELKKLREELESARGENQKILEEKQKLQEEKDKAAAAAPVASAVEAALQESQNEVAELKAQLAQLSKEKAEVAAMPAAPSPDLQKTQKEVAELLAQVAQLTKEKAELAATAPPDVQKSQNEVSDLTAQVAQLTKDKAELAKLVEAQGSKAEAKPIASDRDSQADAVLREKTEQLNSLSQQLEENTKQLKKQQEEARRLSLENTTLKRQVAQASPESGTKEALMQQATTTIKAREGSPPQDTVILAPVSRAQAEVDSKASEVRQETYGTLMMGINNVYWCLPGAKVFLGTGDPGASLLSELFDLPDAMGADVDGCQLEFRPNAVPAKLPKSQKNEKFCSVHLRVPEGTPPMRLRMNLGDEIIVTQTPLATEAPLVLCSSIRSKVDANGTLEVGLSAIEVIQDKIVSLSSTRIEWHLKQVGKKLEIYRPGLSLGWTESFNLGDNVGLQLDFFPNGTGDDSDEDSEDGGALDSCVLSLHPGQTKEGFGYVLFVGKEQQCGVATGPQRGKASASNVIQHTFKSNQIRDRDTVIVGVELILQGQS